MLVTTRAKIEEDISDSVHRKDWVAFVLEAREIMPFDLDQLSRFIVRSISFTTNVQSISLIVNNKKVLQVHTNNNTGKFLLILYDLNSHSFLRGRFRQ